MDGIQSVRRAFATAARVLTVGLPVAAGLMPLCLPALAQQPAVSTNGVDPRRQGNASKVAAEIESREPQGSVADQGRVDDAYQPKGVKLGSFLLFPDFSIREAYNNNIYATRNDYRGDFITTLNPSVKLRSQFDRHMLNFSGELEQNLYKAYNDDNHLNLRSSVDGRFDVGSTTELTGFFSLYRQHEDRASPDAVAGEKPTPYLGSTTRLGGKTVDGRWVYTLNGAAQTYDYESVQTSSGTTISNDGRDRKEYEAAARVGYEMFPGYFVLSELSVNERAYDRSINVGGVDRSSSGYRAEAGVGVDLSRLVRGDFLVGYLGQDYEDPTLSDPSGLSLQSVLNWTPTPQTLVVFSLKREVAETTNATASSIMRNSSSVLVRHELRRNIIASVFGRVDYDQYEGRNGKSWTYETRGSLTYVFNPNVYMSGELSYRQRDADGGVANNYDQTIAFVRAGVRM